MSIFNDRFLGMIMLRKYLLRCWLMGGGALVTYSGSAQLYVPETKAAAKDVHTPTAQKAGYLAQAPRLAPGNKEDRAIFSLTGTLLSGEQSLSKKEINDLLRQLVLLSRYRYPLDEEQLRVLEKVADNSQVEDSKSVHLPELYYEIAKQALQHNENLKALIAFEQALKLLQGREEPELRILRGAVYNKISQVWGNLNETNKASVALAKAEQIARREKENHLVMEVYHTKGNGFINSANEDSAYFYLMAAYRLSKQYSWEHHLACGATEHSSASLALVLLHQRKTAEALSLVDEEIAANTRMRQELRSGDFFVHRAAGNEGFLLYLKGYAFFERKDYPQAEKMLHAAWDAIRQVKDEGTEIAVLKLLTDLYDSTGQYKQAFVYEERLAEVYRGDHRNDAKREIVNFYYNLKKEKAVAGKRDILIRQKAAIKEKNLLIAGATTGALLLIISIVALYKHRRSKRKLRSASLAHLEQEREIVQLESKIEGEQKERQHIANELHDSIVSQLLALKLNMETIRDEGTEADLSPYELNEVALRLNDVTEDLRRTAHHLMPDLLMQKGLVLSVASLCEKNSIATNKSIDFQHYGSLPKLAREIQLTLFRMIQELMHNALKYTDLSQLLVQISYLDDWLSITIEHDGAADSRSTGEELNSTVMQLQDKIQLLKGEIDIQQKEGKNTTVYLEFPLNALI